MYKFSFAGWENYAWDVLEEVGWKILLEYLLSSSLLGGVHSPFQAECCPLIPSLHLQACRWGTRSVPHGISLRSRAWEELGVDPDNFCIYIVKIHMTPNTAALATLAV